MRKYFSYFQQHGVAKRILSFCMALVMLLTLIPASALQVNAAAGDTLYLKPNSNWLVDNARFAAYFFGGSSAVKWVSMTDSDGDGYYEVTVPSGSYPKVIFCRMNPNSTTNNWDNKWNQTGDLTIPTDGKNCFTVPNGAWDGSTSTWSTYTVKEPESSAGTEVTYSLVGDMNSWNTSANPLEGSGDSVSATVELTGDSYTFKIVGSDGVWYGNDGTIEDTTETTSATGWEMSTTAGNCTLKATGGTYTFTFNTSTKKLVITHEASVVTDPVDPTDPTTPTDDDKVIIHFLNNLNWQAVCAYVWAEKGSNDASISGWSWPGQVLSKDADGYYTLELNYAPASGYGLGMLFHNNSGAQTVDLTISNATLTAAGATEVWVQPKAISEDKYSCNVAYKESDLVISPEVNGTSVTFRYGDSATSVKVAGNMLASDWSKQTAMTKGSDGIWSCTMTVEPGVYQYKFIVNGSWGNDPANPVTIGSDANNVLTVADPDAVDNDEITVKLHYTRPDGNYTDWNVWMWTLTKAADQYDFATENGEKVATITLDGRKTRALSYIVRKGKWVSQEYGERQVDLSTVVSGTVHCYVTSGQQPFSVVMGPDVITANKILNTSFDYDNNTISITTALPVSDPATAFDIEGVTIKSISTDGCTYTIIPNETLSLTTLYQNVITFEGHEYTINYTTTVYASDKFDTEYTYTGGDLGATWSASSTTFRVWAPTATEVQLALYASGTEDTDDCIGTYTMTKGEKGVWSYKKTGDLNGTYYTYLVTVDGKTVEACDPYARTTGVNGKRAMVIDLDSTDPEGWDADTNPNPLTSYTDAVIYELHVRDFSIDDSSGVSEANRGKFLALTEHGTTTAGGTKTGLDYLADLGFTHLHLLPIYDYASVDETTCDTFNWGYDPQNYNVPEGSYSTDPYNGQTRVSEMKQMVKALHDNGISVIMDVVYNHVYDAGTFGYNMIVPNYFSRQNPDGSFSNGSGCGNDTASEREMIRDYIVDSVMYWKEEYHIDGFRFDLVGLLDAKTINEIVNTVHAKYPDVIFYGEGWTMGTAVEGGTDKTIMATQANSAHTPEFAYFSDTIRNLLGGQNGNTKGFVSGLTGQEEAVANNFMARPGWTSNPYQIIQYASCHDNYTLVDKIILSTGRSGVDSSVIKMNNLAAAIYMTSQGVPFIHAGEEFLREKLEEDGTRCENSYNAPDSVNHIEWSNLDNATYAANSEYYKGLIEFRKNHAALRMTNATDITNNVTYSWIANEVVRFQINGGVNGEIADSIIVIFNANSSAKTVSLPSGTWSVCIDATNAGVKELYTASGSVSVPGISAMVLVKGDLAISCEHDYEATVTKPTCTTGGYTTYVCSACGDSYIGDTTEKLGHSYEGTVTEPTCTEGGYTTYVCSVCSHSYTDDETEPSGHSYTDGVCGVCGAADPDYVVPTTDYYLFGYINGANYACEEDYENLGKYKFVDGKLTTTFEETSYVAVKTGDNGTWYMTDDWQGNVTSVTLYDSSVYDLGTTANKLMVPGGVEVTFTLTVNSNDTLTLSYTTASTGGDADAYYLFGYIDGASYGEGDDYANVGEYKFTDGKLTTTFAADSYVGVKTGDNSTWYMTDGWQGSVKRVTLYDTGVYSLGTTADKLMVPGGVEVTFTLTVNSDNTVTLSYEADTKFITDTSGIQDGLTLHCWNWSFAEIEANMALIAEQGYTAIQTSPIQMAKEATNGSLMSTHWWVYYQPANFAINTDSGNALGTKAAFESMVEVAHEYGIKVIVDVVANHLGNASGNDLSTAIPDQIRNTAAYWHDYTIDTTDYTDRYDITQHCMGGLPDLNTGHDDIQNYVLTYLKECIDAGADGFRFDAAKHIETPEDDAAFASDFWPTVINGAEAYAKSSRNIDLYVYGELLDAPGGTLPISAYTKYMAVTDNSWGNTLRGGVASGNAAAYAEGYNKATDASQLILWAESHDTYANTDQDSDSISVEDINKTWALIAARADAMGLYFARPDDYATAVLGESAKTGWSYAVVKEANLFHNAFVGQAEYLSNADGIAYCERGTEGVVLVNVAGTTKTVSLTAKAMADGTYMDQISGNTFTVSGGKITGTIGSTGIAVVYNAEETIEKFDIAMTSMTMGNSLAMNVAFEKGNVEDWTGHYAVITKTYADGRENVVETVALADWKSANIGGVAHYYVTFNGIAAKEMTDDIHVEIFNADGDAVSNVYTDSVAAQSARILAKSTTSDEEKTMIVDMLNYGAAAQEYFGYGTDNLANAGLNGEQAAYASAPKTCTDIRVKGTNYVATNVVLKSNIQMMFAFQNIDTTMTAKVTFTNHRGAAKEVTINGSDFTKNGNFYVVTVDALVVADGRQAVTCVIYDANGNQVANATDSLESYTARKNGAEDIFVKMMQYSDSAYAYFH